VSTSAEERDPDGQGDTEVARTGRLAINEDWAATIAGLLLLVAVLAGVIPGWLVP
jgi:hypothetical protein